MPEDDIIFGFALQLHRLVWQGRVRGRGGPGVASGAEDLTGGGSGVRTGSPDVGRQSLAT
ncbi:uncharacterized protein EI90DRAFT_3123349 [Cantharellus anzutake]|uniref:uncharacterized protein n=1 Tax=Cantharellus anzutake TaxID=1750568 RepID=UPI001907FAE3|nr:uncharacterized protein EI90DRAFT_3123349 [Cantharellus anzutake]KAF8331728.1 hypothetical protein EI90DRAFT_3123349 [Cantharellus anzutake]